MVHDPDRQMWVSIGRKGLYRIEDGQWRKHGGLDGLLDDMAMCLAKDGQDGSGSAICAIRWR
jgi:hypothetical protein